jgi:hypothetical protein
VIRVPLRTADGRVDLSWIGPLILIPRELSVPESDRQWLAGFLEGEGTFRPWKTRKRDGTQRVSLKVKVGQCQRWPLEKCLEIIRMGTIRMERRNHRNPKHRDIYTIEWTGKRAEAVMRLVYDAMSPDRQVQIENAFIVLARSRKLGSTS